MWCVEFKLLISSPYTVYSISLNSRSVLNPKCGLTRRLNPAWTGFNQSLAKVWLKPDQANER